MGATGSRRVVCGIALGLGSAVVWFLYFYGLRRQRWARWEAVPSSAWEQIGEQMRHGRQVPLDAVQVLADIQAWLNGGGNGESAS